MRRSIGILLTSNDTSDFARRFADDGEKFRRLLQPLRPNWDFVTIAAKDGILPARTADHAGYVITGSPASVNDAAAWIDALFGFIRQLASEGRPTFGACFGHQALAAALGGKVETSPSGWGLGTAPTQFSAFAPWMTPKHDQLRLFAAHNEQVTALPAGAEILGGNATCPIGAYRIGSRIFATEYHPEMTPDFMAALIDHLGPSLDPQTLAAARASAPLATDGSIFAGWIVNFLEQQAG